MADVLVPIALSSEIDKAGDERIHAAKFNPINRNQFILPPPPPVLLASLIEYEGMVPDLTQSTGDVFPDSLVYYFGIADGTAITPDGLVIVTVTPSELSIYRWSGTAYIKQTITGSITLGSYMSVAVKADGSWVYVLNTNNAGYGAFKYTGSGYSLQSTQGPGTAFANGLALSPDESKLVAATANLRTFSIDPVTGALTISLNATLGLSGNRFYHYDWVGNYILGSRCEAPSLAVAAVYDATTGTKLATYSSTGRSTTGKAWFDADALYVYLTDYDSTNKNRVRSLSFTGSALTTVNSYDTIVGTDVTQDSIRPNGARTAFIRSNGKVFVASAGVMTVGTILPNWPVNATAQWTNL